MPTIEEIKALPKEEKEAIFNELKSELELKEEEDKDKEEIVEEESNEENKQDDNVDEKLDGGKGDNLTIEQLAEKHNVSVDTLEIELEKAIEIELEHTDDREVAKEIAMDHLSEQADYYEKLEKVENSDEKPNELDSRFSQIEKSFEEKLNMAMQSYEERLNNTIKTLEEVQKENAELKRTQPMGNFTQRPNEGDLKKVEKRDEIAIKYKKYNEEKNKT